jgi:hypothetical protein
MRAAFAFATSMLHSFERLDADPAAANVRAIVRLERQSMHEKGWVDRVTERIARFAGSLSFVPRDERRRVDGASNASARARRSITRGCKNLPCDDDVVTRCAIHASASSVNLATSDWHFIC